jgi:hypothetical protein
MKTPMAVTAAKAKYESADTALDAFVRQHRDIFEEYEQLVVYRNEVLGAFKAAVSDHADKLGSKFGPWKISIPRSLDAERLITELGKDAAEVYLKVKLSVDSKIYDQGVAQGKISEDVQEAVEGDGSPRLNGPKAVGIYAR